MMTARRLLEDVDGTQTMTGDKDIMIMFGQRERESSVARHWAKAAGGIWSGGAGAGRGRHKCEPPEFAAGAEGLSAGLSLSALSLLLSI